MKQITWLIAGLAVVAGCQRSGGSTVSETYRGDIERLCDVVARSGADRLPAGERTLAIANWLASNLETREAHDYLIRIQPLTGEPKAAALDAEARRTGLARCALAGEWRGAPTEAGSM
jgi:hypothetical protein